MAENYETIRQQLNSLVGHARNPETVLDILLQHKRIHFPAKSGPLTSDYHIFRARAHGSITRFNHPHEVSYIKDQSKVQNGRANMWGNPVFYGCVASEEVREGIILACNEVAVRGGSMPPCQTFTVSVWKPKRSLDLIIAAPSETQTKGMSALRDMSPSIEEMMKDVPVDEQQRTRELLEVLGHEFTKEIESFDDYLISAVFSSVLYLEAAGIAYPSVRNDYKCLNIAIPFEVAEPNLELVGAEVVQYHTYGDRIIVSRYEFTDARQDPFVWLMLHPYYAAFYPYAHHDYTHRQPH